MATIYTNFIQGALSGGIGASDTVLNSAAFADLPVLSGSDVVKLVLDPFGEFGTPEIVYATTHAASSTTVSGVLRGQEQDDNSGPARSHGVNTVVVHVPVASDWEGAAGGIETVKNSPGTELSTSAPINLVAGGTNAAGTSTSISRSDHRHGLTSGSPTASNPGDASAEGTSTAVARADHKHARETTSLEHLAVFASEGTLSVKVGKGEFPFPFAATILGVSARVGTAPTGAPIIIDVNRNGTSIFTTQANRPQIAASARATAAEVTNMDVTSIAAGQYLTADVDQVGSSVAGADLTVAVRYRRA